MNCPSSLEILGLLTHKGAMTLERRQSRKKKANEKRHDLKQESKVRRGNLRKVHDISSSHTMRKKIISNFFKL